MANWSMRLPDAFTACGNGVGDFCRCAGGGGVSYNPDKEGLVERERECLEEEKVRTRERIFAACLSGIR